MPILALAVLLLSSFAPVAGAQGPPAALQRTGLSHADLFIASFGPAGGDRGLRTGELEMREQVRLAFYGIDATRLEVERGRLTEEEGQRIIDTYEDTLRNFVHDQSNEAWILAGSGQASDIPRIARSLGGLLGVARQDALMGREDVAMEAQAKMIHVLRTFSQRFADTCDQQTFKAEVALAIERQNQMLGTGIDVTHCAERRLTATLEHRRVRYDWENCSIDGGGDWKVKLSGFLSGEGRVTGVGIGRDGRAEDLLEVTTRVEGPSIRGRHKGIEDHWTLGFELRVTGRKEEPASPPAAPDDAGPNARPNHWPRASVPAVSVPESFAVGTLRMEAIHVVGDGYFPEPDWVESQIVQEERPCPRAGR